MTNWVHPELGSYGVGPMTRRTQGICASARSAVIAAAVIAMSGMLDVVGQPICSVIGRVTRDFAAAQSEARRLRDKAARVSAARDWLQSPNRLTMRVEKENARADA